MPASASAPYPSELGDHKWAILAPLLPPGKAGGRPRTVDLRVILTGIFHVLRSGCQWRMLPREYGPWSTVYAYFRTWRLNGAWEHLHTLLRERVRQQVGCEPTPSAAILARKWVRRLEARILGQVVKQQANAAEVDERLAARGKALIAAAEALRVPQHGESALTDCFSFSREGVLGLVLVGVRPTQR